MRSVAKDRTLPENLLSLDPTHHHVDFRLPHSEQASRSPRSRIGWSAPRRCVSWAVRLDPRIHSMPSRYVPGLANPEVPFASSSEGDFDDRESAGLSSGEPGWPRQWYQLRVIGLPEGANAGPCQPGRYRL